MNNSIFYFIYLLAEVEHTLLFVIEIFLCEFSFLHIAILDESFMHFQCLFCCYLILTSIFCLCYRSCKQSCSYYNRTVITSFSHFCLQCFREVFITFACYHCQDVCVEYSFSKNISILSFTI